MQYFKSARFLVLLFSVFTLMIACISTIIATQTASQWHLIHENVLDAGMFDAEVQTSFEAPHWIIRAHEERIGVFRLDGELEYLIDVYLITLPEADQKLLKHGIYVAGEDQLASFIEDYTG